MAENRVTAARDVLSRKQQYPMYPVQDPSPRTKKPGMYPVWFYLGAGARNIAPDVPCS